MISIDTIEQEIYDLEARGETTYAQCERLAWLYVVRDHLISKKNNGTLTPNMQGSEFLELASGVSLPELMSIINEHLETVKVLYPKTYDSLLSRIRALK